MNYIKILLISVPLIFIALQLELTGSIDTENNFTELGINYFAYAQTNLQDNNNSSCASYHGKENTNEKLSAGTRELDDFTLLVYIVGSDLESEHYEATKDIQEMLKNNVYNPKVNIVLETGGSEAGPDPDNNRTIDFSVVQRHVIENNEIKQVCNLGLENMGKTETLLDFWNWGISNYPAKKYGLILWDHGGSYGGFGRDSNHDNDGITLFELGDAIHSPKMKNILDSVSPYSNIEFIGFDSCLMASLEVASSIHGNLTREDKTNVKFLIASEETEPNWGWDYTHIINVLKNNPDISGKDLGEQIALSYANDSKRISKQAEFYADRDITLSVLDMKNVSNLMSNLTSFLDDIKNILKQPNDILSLLHVIDYTEHYGRTTDESFGIVDLYSLIKNIEEEFPNLSEKAKTVKEAINSTIVYQYHGESHPDSNGISFYFPITSSEYNFFREINGKPVEGRQINLLTLRFMIIFSRLYTHDDSPPQILSARNGSTFIIKTGDKIKNFFYDIYINNGNKSKVFSQQDPYTINKKGNIVYKSGKLLELCNESRCIPLTMTMQNTKDVKKIYVPALIVSNTGVQTRTTLLYAFQNNKFFFLGGINDDQIIKGKAGINGVNTLTIGKERISLQEGDTIFTQELNPLQFSLLTNSKIFSDQFKTRFSSFGIGDFIKVNDPGNVTLKLMDANISAIQFILCDFSSLCGKSKLYNLGITNVNHNYSLSHFIFNQSQEEPNQNISQIYVNQVNDFQLKYPSNWVPVTTDINAKRNFNTFNTDLGVTGFFPLEGINNSSIFPKTVLYVEAEDSLNSSLEDKFNYFKGPDFQTFLNPKSMNSTKTEINGFPAFEILGSDENDTLYIVGIEMSNRIYVFYSFMKNSDLQYLPIVKNIINSIKPNQFVNTDTTKLANNIINETQLLYDVDRIRADYILKNAEVKVYDNSHYNLSLAYLSFQDDIHNQDIAKNISSNNVRINFPFVDLFNITPPYLTISHPENESVIAELQSVLMHRYASLIKNMPMLNSEVKAKLFLSEVYVNALPNQNITEWHFLKLGTENLTGIITKYTFYAPEYSMFVNGKSLSFFKDGKYIRIALVSPSDFGLNERIFDIMIRSLKFG